MWVWPNADLQGRLIAGQHILPMVNQQKRSDAIDGSGGERLFNPDAAHGDPLCLDDAVNSVAIFHLGVL